LRPEWDRNTAAVQRLAREAMVGRTIRHPHVVPVLAAHVTEHSPYLVMPWLTGATLDGHSAAGRSFSVPDALWIARQAAAGLAALYEAGYIHGDVKPANLFVSPEGHVTLIDLGFARRSDEPIGPARAALTGTREYLAPECRGGTKPDVRADIFSLGLVLAELLFSGNVTCEPDLPARGADRSAEAARRIRAMVGLPDGLIALVRQMLAHDPLRRVQAPAELVGRLTALEIATFSQRSWR
jgi:serine/threonine protein kinase